MRLPVWSHLNGEIKWKISSTLGKPEAPQATAFSTNFNSELADMLDKFIAEHPEIEVVEFDVFSFAIAVKNDPTD
ncbi:MAG: hypothetical protein WBV95_00610 [Desulfobacterales bacterium]